jgi:signal peptidase II
VSVEIEQPSDSRSVLRRDREAGAAPLRAFGFGLAVAIFILDQIVKFWIIEEVELQGRGYVDVLPFFNLTWVENRGVSMGMLTADGDLGRWLLVALTAAISAGVAVWLWRERSRLDVTALGLVLGGALGNIVDRIRFGYVVDFLHFFWGEWHFYVFNVADAAITVGVILLLLRALLRSDKPARAESE